VIHWMPDILLKRQSPSKMRLYNRIEAGKIVLSVSGILTSPINFK
jgi:hypothetical protein